jgi:transcriptional regulator with XRE-family HTH domain
MQDEIPGDRAVLQDLGRRVAQHRINRDLTQEALAYQAGVGRATVQRLESGRSVQLTVLVRVLRVLGLLDAFDRLLPDTGPSPMALLRERRRRRRRASRRPDAGSGGDGPPTGDADR